ncbi:MAG: prenyltransferase [Paludibacteraceae bacterium]|nr:prenyltransferase [Paludibacteraceae bacterium]
MSSLRFWIKNARSISLPQSALPCLTAIVLCIGQEGFVWWLSLPIFLGVCALHLGMNLADDYFDFKHDSRIRADINRNSVRARMEKCHYLHREGDNTTGEGESPKATVSQLGWAIVGFLAFAALMGGIALVTQWLLHGWQAAMGIVLYAVLGLVVGINYSGKPLELGFHGLGELVIGLMFGPLCMLGVQAAMTGHIFSWEMACISIAIGCLVTNIVYVHSVMEVDADAQLGKMTFARLLFEGPKRKGKEDKGKKRMIIYIGVFAIMPFALLGLGIVLGWWSPWYLMTLLTLPMSIFLIHSTRLFAYGLPRNDKPRWWMGPMGEWDKYVKAGMDWFLFRWLLARNICTFFCLILIIVHLLN